MNVKEVKPTDKEGLEFFLFDLTLEIRTIKRICEPSSDLVEDENEDINSIDLISSISERIENKITEFQEANSLT